MARLTIASLTETLAAQGISLTKTSKGYTVVMANGFSFMEPTLSKVQDSVVYELNKDLTEADYYLTEEEQKKYDEGESYSDREPQTEPTQAEAYNIQYVRCEQLFNEMHKQGLPMPAFGNTETKEDEQKMGELLVKAANERRELKQEAIDAIENIGTAIGSSFVYQSKRKQNQSDKWALGFAGFGHRVNAKLQRRANRFHSLLATAA
jgi:nitrate reductase NapAB chaperone NapD